MRQTLMAHITLSHDAAFFRIFRHFIRAHQNAVLAADTLVIQMAHDSRKWILVVRQHGTSIEATWLDTVMAGGCDRLLKGTAALPMEQSRAAPGFVFIEAVEGVT